MNMSGEINSCFNRKKEKKKRAKKNKKKLK